TTVRFDFAPHYPASSNTITPGGDYNPLWPNPVPISSATITPTTLQDIAPGATPGKDAGGPTLANYPGAGTTTMGVLSSWGLLTPYGENPSYQYLAPGQFSTISGNGSVTPVADIFPGCTTGN